MPFACPYIQTHLENTWSNVENFDKSFILQNGLQNISFQCAIESYTGLQGQSMECKCHKGMSCDANIKLSKINRCLYNIFKHKIFWLARLTPISSILQFSTQMPG